MNTRPGRLAKYSSRSNSLAVRSAAAPVSVTVRLPGSMTSSPVAIGPSAPPFPVPSALFHSPEEGLDGGKQFTDAEGFGDIIVRSHLQPERGPFPRSGR